MISKVITKCKAVLWFYGHQWASSLSAFYEIVFPLAKPETDWIWILKERNKYRLIQRVWAVRRMKTILPFHFQNNQICMCNAHTFVTISRWMKSQRDTVVTSERESFPTASSICEYYWAFNIYLWVGVISVIILSDFYFTNKCLTDYVLYFSL